MTPAEAVGFLTQAAWKRHTPPCLSDVGCTCGAVQHNTRVKEALLTIGRAAKARRK